MIPTSTAFALEVLPHVLTGINIALAILINLATMYVVNSFFRR